MGILITFFLFSCVALEVTANASVKEYLDRILRQSKVEIAKAHIQELPPVPVKSYKVQWDKLWHEELSQEQSFIVNKFDKTVILEGNRIVTLSTNVTNVPFSNETALQEVAQIRRDNTVKFVRSIVWKSMLYLLICYEKGSCSLYTSENDLQLRHRQTIQHRGLPMDACFFTRANRLYLVVAANSGPFTVPSVIYHWRGTYMDIDTQVMTTAAVTVTTFKHKQSTIIIFAQNDRNVPSIGSVVYEFKESSLDRIQFLPTVKPISIHHYNHKGLDFILLMNEVDSSNLFWWDGQELLSWQELPSMRAPSLIRIVNIEDYTVFVVAHENILQLYKFESATDYTNLDSMRLEDGEIVIDMSVWIVRSRLNLVLITLDKSSIYNIQQWELRINEISHEDSTTEMNHPSKCLPELIEILQSRMSIVEEAQSSWSSLLSATENLTISDPIILSNLILDSGTIENIELIDTEEAIPPKLIENELNNLSRQIEDLLLISLDISSPSMDHVLKGDVLVEGDAFVKELKIESLNVDSSNVEVTHSKDTEKLPNSLHGGNILLPDIKVDSLCGIPTEYWALKNDKTRMILNLDDDKIEFANNTAVLHSNVSLPALKVKTLNDMDVDTFISELFLLNHNQKIKGNITYKSALNIASLTMETLNTEPVGNFLTTTSNQTFDEFYIKTLQIDNLYAETINGVPVSEAALVSQANVIKGEVKVANLRVKEQLIIDTDCKLPKVKSLQVYSNVTIKGDLKVKTINFEKDVVMYMNGKEVDINGIFETHWTKSTDQIIKENIKFESDFIIDRLDANYLNGFSVNDFLYTTVKEIPKNFGHLHFKNLHFNESIFVEGENASFFDLMEETLTIQKETHVKHLRTDDLHVDVFNEVLVNDILHRKEPLIFSKDTSFTTIRAKHVNVDELNVLFFNNENISSALHNRNVEEHVKNESDRISEFHVEDLFIERINGVEIKELSSLNNFKIEELKDLIIEGDLRVMNSLMIQRIDEEPADLFLENIAEADIVITREELLEELIVHNLTLNFLHGYKVNTLFDNIFSKTKDQVVKGGYSFYNVFAKDVDTRLINEYDTSQLMWIDEPLNFTGNVIFEDLLVEGDISTRDLNGGDINELYENLLNIPLKNIIDLEITGNISWRRPSSESSSLTYLLENAVTKNTDQIIYGDTTFQNDVLISKMFGELKEVKDIENMISDAVLDHEESIQITGKKIFKESLIIDNLLVINDVNIPTINNISILEFNNSVVKKYQDDIITNPIVFLDEVIINELFINDSIHEAPLNGLALTSDTLPDNITFKHLVILQNVYLKNLDDIDFNKFVEERITLSGDHEISTGVQFNGPVEVSGNTTVEQINGINPSDLVLNGIKETQLVYGVKTFEEDLVVNENMYAALVNNIDLLSEYSSGIQNDESVEIFGNIVFEAEVNILENITVSGLVNNVKLHSVLDDLRDHTHSIFKSLNQNESIIEEKINRAAQISESLKNIFVYFEIDEELKIGVQNIHKVDVVYIEETTKLNMFGEESGDMCGLPSHCSCPLEYMAELTTKDCRVWRTNGTTIVRNFHEANSAFGINVVTNVVSSSSECTSSDVENEFTTISWMKHGVDSTGDTIAIVENGAERIKGFLKDAQVFMYNDAAYIVLAIYYDPVAATHRTDSLIYKIDFEKNELSLHQKLSTDAAWDIQVFKTDHYPNVYLLVGCFGNSSESLLFRLNIVTSKFVLLRSFPGKSRYVKSLSQEKDSFVLLEGFDTNAVNVYYYNSEGDNFYNYQSLYHDSRVTGIECFYVDEFRNSDSFVIVTTEDEQFYVYEYLFAQKFRLKTQHSMDALQTMVPFVYLEDLYIFAGRNENSTILKIVQQGPR